MVMTSRTRELIWPLLTLASLAILLFIQLRNPKYGWLIVVTIALLIATGIAILLKLRQQ
jgi:hypothetical protein